MVPVRVPVAARISSSQFRGELRDQRVIVSCGHDRAVANPGMFIAALGCNLAWGLVGLGLESSSRTRVEGQHVKIVEITYRYDASDAVARPRPSDPDSARDRLDEGSRTIAALLDSLSEGTGTARRVIPVDPRDLGLATGDRSVPEQRPYAAVLGCSDARVPIELIFNEGPNDLFVVRVAGNGLGSEVLGSLKYAVDHLGGSLKLVVVLGHSGCGAVSAAVDVFLDPRTYLSLAAKHSLRNILDRLLVVGACDGETDDCGLRTGSDAPTRFSEALIEAAIVSNAALAAYTVQQEIGSGDPHVLRAAYGVYLLASRQIWAPRSASAACAGLAYPPADQSAFEDFADAVVRSDRIAALLAQGAQ